MSYWRGKEGTIWRLFKIQNLECKLKPCNLLEKHQTTEEKAKLPNNQAKIIPLTANFGKAKTPNAEKPGITHKI